MLSTEYSQIFLLASLNSKIRVWLIQASLSYRDFMSSELFRGFSIWDKRKKIGKFKSLSKKFNLPVFPYLTNRVNLLYLFTNPIYIYNFCLSRVLGVYQRRPSDLLNLTRNGSEGFLLPGYLKGGLQLNALLVLYVSTFPWKWCQNLVIRL